MAKYGLLFNLDRCTGCRTHMVVCRHEGNEIIRLPMYTVAKTAPGSSEGTMWYFPFQQAKCRTSKECAKRVGNGLKPRCVLNCPAQALQFGRIEELMEYIKEKSIPHSHIVPF